MDWLLTSLVGIVPDWHRLASARGADHALVSGSGPTVFGLYEGEDASGRAEAAAARLANRYPGTTSEAPVSEEFGAPRGS